MSESDRAEIVETALPAILVRRSDLPVPLAHAARSFFGGLPRLPPGLQWPRAEVKASDVLERVALTFVAQIDLAELPRSIPSPLPKQGTLYFFCSSVFVGEGHPPCRVLYSPERGDAHAAREPPSDLMPLAGKGGDAQVEWLDPALDFNSCVEFKYPLSFKAFTDYYFQRDPVGGELLTASLCAALGPGQPKQTDLLQWRSLQDYANDKDWPFNWLLIMYVARAVLSRVRSDLRPRRSEPTSEEIVTELHRIQAGAIGWLERCPTASLLNSVEAETQASFRAWWTGVAQRYKALADHVRTYAGEVTGDLGHAIDHTIRRMATENPDACDDAPRTYVENLARRNHWAMPKERDGMYRSFPTPVHQMLGYGSSHQDAPEVHLEDILLLQIQGDLAFFNWHANTGCVLHFWIDPDALARLDFSSVAATLECD